MKVSTDSKNQPQPIEHYISVKHLSSRLDVSVATIWRWVAAGEFPSPVKLSPGCSRFTLGSIQAWESARARKKC